MKATTVACALLLLAAGPVRAEEAELLSPRAETAAEQPRLRLLRAQRHARGVMAVAVDARALEADVVSLTIEGTSYRFRRRPEPARDPASMPGPGVDSTPGAVVWQGTSDDPAIEAYASFVRNGASVSGQITTARRQYDLWPAYAQWPDGAVLVRKDGVFDTRPAPATN